MPRVTFCNSSVRDDENIAASPARLLNLYPVPVAGEGRTTYLLRSVPGQLAKDDIGNSPVRAMGRANGKNWLVGDGKLFEVATSGTVTQRGVVADDTETVIAGNYTDVTVTSGGNYYLWDGSSISQPTTKTFTTVGSHCFVGGYTVLTERAGKRFQWSTRGDASTLDALDFAAAEQVDDNILRAVEFRGSLLLLKETSTEIWQINPDAADSAERFFYSSTTNTGLRAFNLMVRFDDSLFFIGNDSRAYLFGQGAVSIPAVENSIATSRASHCFYYEDAGHKFCVIRFTDRAAWVYDITTGLWHERGEGAGFAPWRAIGSVRLASTPSSAAGIGNMVIGSSLIVGSNNTGRWLIGNISGEVLELARTNLDLSAPLFRSAISSTIYLGDRKFTIAKVEALARVGDHDLNEEEEYGLDAGNGFELEAETGVSLFGQLIEAGPRDANLDFYISRDGARTWVGPKRRSLGRKDDFDQRMIWRAQGQAQQVTMRFDISDPAEITLYSDGVVTAL